MKLNVKELPNEKLLESNVFYGNEFYSFNKDNSMIICAKLSVNMGDKAFGLDNNTMKALLSFKEPEIDLKDGKVVIKENKKRYSAKIDTNTIPTADLTNLENLDIELKRLITARKFTSDKETRPVLTGVCVRDNGEIFASDSYTAYSFTKDGAFKSQIIIPNTFIDYLNDESKLKTNGKMIVGINGNIMHIGRLIAGNFPNISKFCTLPNSKKITFNTAELKECISFSKNVGLDSESKSMFCRLKNDKFMSYGSNEFESDLTVDYVEDYDICFSIPNISRLIDVSNTEFISIDYLSPVYAILRQYVSDNGTETIVITPIRKQF